MKNENLKNTNDSANLELRVTKMLREIGAPVHFSGYNYIRDAIMLAIDDVYARNFITKVIYPEVARKYSTTPSRVERAIRYMIETAWFKGNKAMLDEMFSHTIKSSGKVTNGQFIAQLADTIRLDMKCAQTAKHPARETV